MRIAIKERIRFFVWRVSDSSLARLTELLGVIPPKTLEAILKQNWYFSTRYKACKKLGVEIAFDEQKKKLISRYVGEQPEARK